MCVSSQLGLGVRICLREGSHSFNTDSWYSGSSMLCWCWIGIYGCPPRSVIPAVCYLIESVRLGWNLGLALENMAIKRIYVDWILSTKYIDRGSLPKSGVIIYLLRSVYILFSPNEL